MRIPLAVVVTLSAIVIGVLAWGGPVTSLWARVFATPDSVSATAAAMVVMVVAGRWLPGRWHASAAASLGVGVLVGVFAARLSTPEWAMPMLFGLTTVVAVGTSFGLAAVRVASTTART